MKQYELNLELISKAVAFLKGKTVRTPIEFSPQLSEILETPVYLKLESLQITGSFKVRGALFYLSTLGEQDKKRGIATCSAGNHGLGIAYAAQKEGISCTVYVPNSIDEAKEKRILKLGAVVRRSKFFGYDETLAWAKNEVQVTQQHFISAFEDERIMAGNGGTIATEILEEIPDVGTVLLPIGGGGLGAGLSYYFYAKNPAIQIIGCQLAGSPSLKMSLESGEAVTVLPPIQTIAGGLEGGIGKRCFEVLKTRISEVCLVGEHEIREAFCWALKHHQHIIEPSAIVGIASCLGENKPKVIGKTVILVSGRNVSFSILQQVVTQ